MDEEKELKSEETREEMLSRHRQEMKELLSKETALKKAAAKGSKAEQKAKKKQVDEEISNLLSQLESKHSKELSSLINNNNQNTGKTNLDTLVMAIAGASITPNKEPFKPSKATRRREKRAQEEAAREERIEEEEINGVSDRMIENELLEKKLEPLNLTINEIKPDGNCLYRALENQLLLHPSKTYTYQELRAMAAKYMREHPKDFIPFFLSESNIEDGDEKSVLSKFEEYCDEIESMAAWGGQPELGALTHCLKKHIIVSSGSFPDVEMGEEYKSENERSIMLSYHRHAYGLGKHYNSIISMEAVTLLLE